MAVPLSIPSVLFFLLLFFVYSTAEGFLCFELMFHQALFRFWYMSSLSVWDSGFLTCKRICVIKARCTHLVHKLAFYLSGSESWKNLVYLWGFSGCVFLVSLQVPLAVQFLHHSSEVDTPGWVILRGTTERNIFNTTRLLITSNTYRGDQKIHSKDLVWGIKYNLKYNYNSYFTP